MTSYSGRPAASPGLGRELKALPRAATHSNLVSVTRKPATPSKAVTEPATTRWRLQDAKARFSELVRLAYRDGPQRVTLHGRDAVVVVDANEFNRLQGERTGELLVEALRASPSRRVEIEPRRSPMPVRAVKL
jgi:prevent-host-death family protein